MKLCIIKNCNKKLYAKEFCRAHYQRSRNGTNMVAPFGSLTSRINCVKRDKGHYSFKDLTGQKFGRLTAQKWIPRLKSGSRDSKWECSCECGSIILAYSSNLISGKHTSCGCHRYNYEKVQSSAWNLLYSSCHLKSKNKWGCLSKEQFWKLVKQNCFYCGKSPSNWNPYKRRLKNKNKRGKCPVSKECVDNAWIKKNGVDRINNKIGYILENCVPCCEICNYYAKGDRVFHEFISWMGWLKKEPNYVNEIISKLKKMGKKIPVYKIKTKGFQ